ncbi:MAG: hypothetical protein ACLUUO_07550 [Sellimonas intestinalis]
MERCLIAGQVCQRALEEGNLFAVDGRLAEIQVPPVQETVWNS